MIKILQGHWIDVLKTLPDESVQMCVTSPPYFGLRSYLPKDHPLKHLELGTEKTPKEYISKLVEGFREVKRVLKKDGVIWVNIGDSYFGSGQGFGDTKTDNKNNSGSRERVKPTWTSCGLKNKDLIGTPWMLAFALRDDGWYLRSDIIWAKKNCMPESVTDRPTRSHEYIFLLSKSQKYFYDHEAIKEPGIWNVDGTGTASRKARASADLKSHPNGERAGIHPAGFKDAEKFDGKNGRLEKQRGHSRRHAGFNDRWDAMPVKEQCAGMRNKRDVWSAATACFPEAHFATFPRELITPCILAGSRYGDTVLDCFGGSGTTGMASLELGRKAILIELNPDYIPMAERRTNVTIGLELVVPDSPATPLPHPEGERPPNTSPPAGKQSQDTSTSSQGLIVDAVDKP